MVTHIDSFTRVLCPTHVELQEDAALVMQLLGYGSSPGHGGPARLRDANVSAPSVSH